MFLLQDPQMSDELATILIVFLVVFLIIWLFHNLFKSEKKSSHFNGYNPNNLSQEEAIQEFLNGPHAKTGHKFRDSVHQLADEIPKCSKCRMSTFQFWLFTTETVEFKCLTCKKKHQYYQEDLNTNLNNLYKLWEDYHYHCYAWTANDHPDIKGKVPTMYQWSDDMGGIVQVGVGQQSYVRIVIEAKGELKEKVKGTNERSRRISQAVMDKVWRRDEGKCVQCGSQENLEFDHIIPFSKNGSNTYRNIQLLCESCNRKKSAKIG